MKLIPLTKGKFTQVDDEDYDILIERKFYYTSQRVVCNVKENGKWKNVAIHHLILGKPKKGFVIDHINRDPLDNRRCNLRVCTQSNNIMNTTKRPNFSSKYKGVSYIQKTKKYQSTITINGVQKNLGAFKNEIDAAIKYNEAVIKYFGEYGVLNVLT